MEQDLKKKLSNKQANVRQRYEFYEMKNRMRDFQISTPPTLNGFAPVLGWCGKAVDSIADRIQFRAFEEDAFDVSGIFTENNPDVIFDSGIVSALISSCSFVYISQTDAGAPVLQIIDGGNATGRIDDTTGLLTEGYAILSRDEKTGKPQTTAFFEPYRTTYTDVKEKKERVFDHPVPHPLLVPLVYRPDAVRPFGHSRISRACMSIVESALRTVKRSEISAEFFSFPQKYAVGLAQDYEMDKWKMSMSAMLTITKDDDGDTPKLGQFEQQSMAPHVDQLRMFAGLFAAETGLSLAELGFTDSNPASADSIINSREPLLLTARKAQRNFGSGFLNVGFLAASLRDKKAYERKAFARTRAVWYPVFDPNLSTLGDGIVKINQAVPGYFDAESLHDLTGVAPASVGTANSTLGDIFGAKNG